MNFRRANLACHRHPAGFTLAEMVTATTIFALLVGMIVQFNQQTFKSMFVSEQKCLINNDMRSLTSRMSQDARDANFFVLYANYTASARANSSLELLHGNSGDFLVLVSYGAAPNPAKFNIRPVSEIIGYYRAPYQSNQLTIDPISNAPSNVMPVRRFDITVGNGLSANMYLLATGSSDLPPGGTATSLEALLPSDAAATIAGHQIVVQLAQGLDDGLLFHNYNGKSIMINGKIMHGNNDVSATDTYNFTVSPRG